ncbi:MAG: Uma2 family endonuclease [Gemmataceae bacterium]|nr:Uma2 family endonuclease [Gemmataceae bacterium]
MNLNPIQPSPTWSMDQLRRHFGMIPAERIILEPPPGTATEADAIHATEHGHRLCELVDGVLVEKAMGAEESDLALWLSYWLRDYLLKHNLGRLLGESAILRLMPGLLLAPDLSFIRWERYPKGKPAVPSVSPDLAVEVISRSNTKKEIARKRREYFTHGASLVWEIDPRKETVAVYTSLKKPTVLGIEDSLDGGKVLPGFKLRVSKLFNPPEAPSA